MRPSSVLIASTALFTSIVTGHSWLECTDYRITQGSADSKIWNKEVCFGNARCGKRQADSGFGVDTGFNYHSGTGCQCARGSDNYDGIKKATYTPGQRVCIAYPPKNHVAAPCTNQYIPDAGTIVTRTAVNPTSDSTPFIKNYDGLNGKHQSGSVDYKGFQNCPNFCADKEKSLCTMCFDLEADITPGEYSFKWMWSFNSKDDTYSTCWEAKVVAGGAESASVIPLPAPIPDSPSSPSVTTSPSDASVIPLPAPVPDSTSPSDASVPKPTEPAYIGGDELECEDDENKNEEDCEDPLPQAGDDEDCEDPLPQAGDDEDCEDPLPQAGDDEDCEDPLPVATDSNNKEAYNPPAQPAIAPAPAPGPGYESGAMTTQKPESESTPAYGTVTTQKPEAAQPDYTTPTTQKPEAAQPDYTTPTTQKPDATQPDYTTPTTQKPEDASAPSSNPDDLCGVTEDTPAEDPPKEDAPIDEGPGKVQPYS